VAFGSTTVTLIGNQIIALCIDARLSGDLSLFASRKILLVKIAKLMFLKFQLHIQIKQKQKQTSFLKKSIFAYKNFHKIYFTKLIGSLFITIACKFKTGFKKRKCIFGNFFLQIRAYPVLSLQQFYTICFWETCFSARNPNQ